MARAVFPDPGDRLVVSSNGYGHPLISAAGATFVVYGDEPATVLADIRTLDGDVIAGSLIQANPQSFLPYFLGPDGRVTLYLKQQSGTAPVFPISCRGGEILAVIDGGGPGSSFDNAIDGGGP